MSCIQCRKTHFVCTHKRNWKIKVDLPTYEVLTKRVHVFVYLFILLFDNLSLMVITSTRVYIKQNWKLLIKFPVGMV